MIVLVVVVVVVLVVVVVGMLVMVVGVVDKRRAQQPLLTLQPLPTQYHNQAYKKINSS